MVLHWRLCPGPLFATLAIELKRRAPGAHTYLEVIKMRFGPAGHIVFMCFGLATNILVTLMLLTGGSAVVKDLTGMNVVAACLLLPLGVILYTLFGGIKATFITDYLHTIILLVIILVFAFTTYANHDVLGSPVRSTIFWLPGLWSSRSRATNTARI